MKPSMVEKSKEFDDCIIYKTSCECLSNDHNLTIFLEKFKDTEQLSMSFYVKCSVNSYFDINKDSLLTKIFNHIKSRTYYAFKILFT